MIGEITTVEKHSAVSALNESAESESASPLPTAEVDNEFMAQAQNMHRTVESVAQALSAAYFKGVAAVNAYSGAVKPADQIEIWFREGVLRCELDLETYPDGQSPCPYEETELNALAAHWWTRGYSYSFRLFRAHKAEAALAASPDALPQRIVALREGLEMIRDIKPGFSARTIAAATLREDNRIVSVSADALQDEVSKALAELREMFPDNEWTIDFATRPDSWQQVSIFRFAPPRLGDTILAGQGATLSEALAKVREYAGKAEAQKNLS